MKLRLAPLVVGSTLLAYACGFDFVEIERDTPAILTVSVVADEPNDRLALSAVLEPGRARDGSSRPLVSDFTLAGQALVPSGTGTDGRRAYTQEWSLSDRVSSDERINIRAPQLADLPTERLDRHVGIARRKGPSLLRFSPGDTLRLEIDHEPRPDLQTQWTLRVAPTDARSVITFGAFGDPPSEIAFAPDWFPGPIPEAMEIELLVKTVDNDELAEGRYLLSLDVESRLHWTANRIPEE